mmetsp:Transcript_4637/g.4358  ORF Transcript_4637/g.4358 Transcript_4637/m.4358 type:complete len:195 (-) Transcript_4637:25-609(-)
MCSMPYLSPSFRFFIANSTFLLFFCMVMGLSLVCALACGRNLSRSVPTNYILTFFFTLCMGYVASYVCAVVDDPQIVFSAAFMTAGIVIALTIYAMTTKSDFTICGGMLFVVLASFIILGLFSFLFGPGMKLVFCSFGVILFGIYLVADTQMIIGGKRFELDKDEYIFGSIMLYMDIINIFLYLLQFLALGGGE